MKFLVGDRCNVTLGGGRSILLSYWGIYTYKKSDTYRIVANATDAQQMAKSLAALGCHLHAACGRCILLSYWGIYTWGMWHILYPNNPPLSRNRVQLFSPGTDETGTASKVCPCNSYFTFLPSLAMRAAPRAPA